MNLEDYIAETLRQIVSGVAKSQQLTADLGAEVNPKMHSNSTVNSALGIIPTGNSGVYVLHPGRSYGRLLNNSG